MRPTGNASAPEATVQNCLCHSCSPSRLPNGRSRVHSDCDQQKDKPQNHEQRCKGGEECAPPNASSGRRLCPRDGWHLRQFGRSVPSTCCSINAFCFAKAAEDIALGLSRVTPFLDAQR